MPVEAKWLVEGRVILVKHNDVISPEKVGEAVLKTADLISETQSPIVHVITFVYDNMEMQGSVFQFRQAMKPLWGTPKMGWQLLVQRDTNQFLKFMGSIVTQLFKTKYRMYSSLEEAVAFLQNEDPTLPNLKQLIMKELEGV